MLYIDAIFIIDHHRIDRDTCIGFMGMLYYARSCTVCMAPI